MHRPRVKPGLRLAWRDASTLQLGVCPDRGAVLTGLREGDGAIVAALDGVHDLPSLRGVARDHSLPEGRVDELVRLLGDAGLLVRDADAGGAEQADRVHLARLGAQARDRLAGDADAWALVYPDAGDGLTLLAARAGRCVRVDGAGRVAAAVAATLSAAGVGSVYLDEHQPAQLLAPADIVVLVREDVVDVRLADDLVQHDRVHLAVVCTVERVVVGPLVQPGTGPCLRCLDLRRCDRDPGWPHVAAQLLAPPRPRRPRGETACGAVAAGVAALQVLNHLDGHIVPATVGRTLDVVLPDGLVERRRWPVHPSCGCASTLGAA